MKAIQVISDIKDYGYFCGNNYSDPFEDCCPDPVDWAEEAKDVANRLNQIFAGKDIGNVIARIEVFDDTEDE